MMRFDDGKIDGVLSFMRTRRIRTKADACRDISKPMN